MDNVLENKLREIAFRYDITREDIDEIIDGYIITDEEDFILATEKDDIVIFADDRRFLSWYYDDIECLYQLLEVDVTEDMIGKTIGEYLIDSSEQMVRLSSGKIVFIYM